MTDMLVYSLSHSLSFSSFILVHSVERVCQDSASWSHGFKVRVEMGFVVGFELRDDRLFLFVEILEQGSHRDLDRVIQNILKIGQKYSTIPQAQKPVREHYE